MARCRRNVDNFLDACRKLGVDDVSICVDSVFGKEYSSYGFVSLSTRCVTAIYPGIFCVISVEFYSFVALFVSLSLYSIRVDVSKSGDNKDSIGKCIMIVIKKCWV